MLLLLYLAASQKLGPHFSAGLECKGIHSKLDYRRKIILPNYSIKIVQLPQPLAEADLGILFLNPKKHGEKSEDSLRILYKQIFDETFDPMKSSPEYEQFRNNIQILFDLVDDKQYNKRGNHSVAYVSGLKNAGLSTDESADLVDYSGNLLNSGRIFVIDRTPDDAVTATYETYIKCPEGLTLRSRVMDEAVFESTDKIKIVVGPRQNTSPDRPWEFFKVAKNVDDLNLSTEFLARAGIVAHKTGYQKDVELIVVGAPGITEQEIRKKVDSLLQEENYTTTVQSSTPNEKNVALMGSTGVTAAYHYFMPSYIYTLRGGLDHTWGKFCQTAPRGTNTEINPSLGWGAYVGTGADYRWTKTVAVGLEGGLRANQLNVPQIKTPDKTSSTWFFTPYAQVNCTYFTENDATLALFYGYQFPNEFTITSTGTRIPYGSPCKIGGLYGGMRLSKLY